MTLDEFQKIDLRVGRVVIAERVEGSEKLLRLEIDFGVPDGATANENAESPLRQIVSGLGKVYAPEDLIGKQVVVILNLDPRKMMGHESQGMLLAAHGLTGEPIVLTVDKEVPPGSRIT